MADMKLGPMAFSIMIVLSLIGGLGLAGSLMPAVTVLLILCGLVIGVMNISKAEEVRFVVSMIALSMGVGLIAFDIIGPFTGVISDIFKNLLVGVGVATLVVSAKVVYDTANK